MQVFAELIPLALQGVYEIKAGLEEARRNEPEYHDAIEALRNLHLALTELLEAAQAGRVKSEAWRAVVRHKDDFLNLVKEGVQVMAIAPIAAIGTGNVLSLLSGTPLTGTMLTTLCATYMSKNAILTLVKGK